MEARNPYGYKCCVHVFFCSYALIISCDSSSEIFLAKNPTYISMKKNIEIQYHFVRGMVEKNEVQFEKFDTLRNFENLLTHFVNTKTLSWCRELMGIGALL